MAIETDGIRRDPPTEISRVRAYQSIGQNIPDVAPTKVQLDSKIFDVLGEFDNVTNYRFTTTKAGYYLLIGGLGYAAPVAGTIYEAKLYVNGAGVSGFRGHAASANDIRLVTMDVRYLAVGDYVELWGYHNAGLAKSTIADVTVTYMIVHRIGVS